MEYTEVIIDARHITYVRTCTCMVFQGSTIDKQWLTEGVRKTHYIEKNFTLTITIIPTCTRVYVCVCVRDCRFCNTHFTEIKGFHAHRAVCSTCVLSYYPKEQSLHTDGGRCTQFRQPSHAECSQQHNKLLYKVNLIKRERGGDVRTFVKYRRTIC